MVEDLKVDVPVAEGLLHPVRGISFTVSHGKTLAVVGESGCGKSMTALAITHLLPRSAQMSARRLDFAGKSLLALSAREFRRLRGDKIAMILQDPMTALNPSFTIGNQLVETLRQHRRIGRSDAWTRAADLLAKVGITAPETRMKQYPHQLSGGLRQRIVIAMALICEPDLLIADEPTTALDVTTQAQILRLLASLQQEFGMGLMIITHDLGVVASIADEVMVMYGGQAVESGPAKAVFGAPLHPYTEGLLHALPVPGRTAAGEPLGTIRGMVPRQFGELSQCGFVDRCPYAFNACRQGPVDLRDAEDSRQVRCLLPLTREARDPAVWTHVAELAQ